MSIAARCSPPKCTCLTQRLAALAVCSCALVPRTCGDGVSEHHERAQCARDCDAKHVEQASQSERFDGPVCLGSYAGSLHYARADSVGERSELLRGRLTCKHTPVFLQLFWHPHTQRMIVQTATSAIALPLSVECDVVASAATLSDEPRAAWSSHDMRTESSMRRRRRRRLSSHVRHLLCCY